MANLGAPGRIAQRESARFTRGRSLVQSQVRPLNLDQGEPSDSLSSRYGVDLRRRWAQAANDPVVKGLRRQVGAIRPDDRSQLLVELHLCEELGVLQWLEHSMPRPIRHVQLTLGPILKAQAQPVRTNDVDG